jgi:hypothetical protein
MSFSLSNEEFKVRVYPLILEAEKADNIVPYSPKTRRALSDLLVSVKEADKHAKTNPVALFKLKKQMDACDLKLRPERQKLNDECFLIYQRAFQPAKSFILGGSVLRESNPEPVKLMQNFGILAGEHSSAPNVVKRHKWLDDKGAEISIDLETGGVLCDGSWSVFKNDAAMLGVIHSGRSCYTSQLNTGDFLKSMKKDLWDSENNRIKVLGREIAMLKASGYQQVVPEHQTRLHGFMYVPKDRASLSSVRMHDLVQAVDKINTIDKALSLLEFEPEAPPSVKVKEYRTPISSKHRSLTPFLEELDACTKESSSPSTVTIDSPCTVATFSSPLSVAGAGAGYESRTHSAMSPAGSILSPVMFVNEVVEKEGSECSRTPDHRGPSDELPFIFMPKKENCLLGKNLFATGSFGAIGADAPTSLKNGGPEESFMVKIQKPVARTPEKAKTPEKETIKNISSNETIAPSIGTRLIFES